MNTLCVQINIHVGICLYTDCRCTHTCAVCAHPCLLRLLVFLKSLCCLAKANIDLGFSVAFPIIGSLPGIVGLLIGMAFFGEASQNFDGATAAEVWQLILKPI